MGATAALWADAGTQLEALTTTPTTADLTEAYVELSTRYSALFESYGPLLDIPRTAQKALPDFLGEVSVLVVDATAVDDELVLLAVDELRDRDDLLARYVVELLVTLQAARRGPSSTAWSNSVRSAPRSASNVVASSPMC